MEDSPLSLCVSAPDSAVTLPNGSTVAEFQSMILDFYRQEGRSFPWRETRDPYAILVSELMLQQTQTERVVPKYLAWLEAFPTAADLAAAPFPQVLAAWSGLGYNRRAGYLQSACRQVVQELGGVFPSTAKELQRLKGVGAYTAGAVAAFAFNRPEVFIETNIRSVYLFFFYPDQEKVSDAQLMPLIETTLYRPDPRVWYYALMDYGAALKKSTANPNRQSRHYSRQSRFEGSLRQARGAIVRQLSLGGNRPQALEDLAAGAGIDLYRMQGAAESLVSEGMIMQRGNLYCINEQR